MNSPIDQKLQNLLLESSNIVYLRCNSNGYIIENNRYSSLLIAQDCLKERFENIFAVADRRSISSKIRNTVEDSISLGILNINTITGLPQSLDFHVIRQNNEIFVIGSPDIREFEYFRKEILKLTNELSVLSRELQKKNRELAELNKLKNQFLGMAAHDIRKPIGLIKMLSEFLQEEASDSLNDEHSDFINKIHNSSNYMIKLVNDFLDVSRIESGKLDLDLKPVFIVDVLNQAIVYIKPGIHRKNLDIEIIDKSENCKFIADQPKLEQVLINLLSNAVEHSFSGNRIIITIEKDPGYMFFKVKDFGTGIPEKAMENLFDPFGRVGIKKTGNEKSTGLGLVIVKKIVETHKGTISCKSRVGKGTEFLIKLPLYQE